MAEYYRQTAEDVLESLHSSHRGISQEEADKRLIEYGLNKLPEGKVDSYLLIFLHQFQSPLIYTLLVACAIVFIMGETLDAGVILFVLIFNAIIGSIQEGKSQNTLLALKGFSETRATVLRDDKELIIRDKELVPGDIIILQEGEKVPADARIILATNLKIDESSMTGESSPVQKVTDPLEEKGLQNADQKNMLFKGTNILVGSGKAVVVSTGLETVIGKISKEIQSIDTEIPLRANIRYLSRLIIFVVAVLGILMFIIGVLSGNTALEMFSTVISLAVSLIPEGLPIVMTVVLATGVWRMSKRNALVKKLQAVESLGQASVIAVDKTGTITKNEMIVQKIFLPDSKVGAQSKFFDVGGVGYEPKGDIFLDGNLVDPVNHPELAFIGKAGAFCANARVLFSEEEKVWRVSGDPTEAAILVLSQKLGFHKDDLERESPLLSEISFDYKLKYHATVHHINGEKLLAVAGAPEEILKISNRILCEGEESYMSQEERKKLEAVFMNMSTQGHRVIAIAVIPKFSHILKTENVRDLVFVGFLGMKDALRSEVPQAMEDARLAGIRVVMITGDYKITAQSIATEAGIFKDGDLVLTGREIDNFSDDELSEKLSLASVFARVTPEHKLRIIKAYKSRGEIIAMTGDGVNDAPSLVAADLGVAMGMIGTEVAKEAADIVLLDDNFGSIIGAVEEGRSIYKSIKRVILYLVSTGWAEALTIMTALIIGFPLPLLPAQIIWLNFVTDGFLDLSLAMEPKDGGLLRAKFEKPKKYIIDKLMVQRMFFMAIPMVIGTLILFSFYLKGDMVKAWTISITTLAAYQWFNAWNCRHERKSIFQMNLFSNKYLIGATILVVSLHLFLVYNPIMQNLFRTTGLSINEWFIIIPVASSVIWIEEIRKFFYRRRVIA